MKHTAAEIVALYQMRMQDCIYTHTRGELREPTLWNRIFHWRWLAGSERLCGMRDAAEQIRRQLE
jgi:hypothetical protein